KTPEALEGKFGHELYPPDLAEAYHQDDLEVINSAKPKLDIIEQHTAPGTGETTWMRVGKVPFHDTDGAISGVLVFAVDITEQKAAEAERERLQQELIDAQRQAMLELSTPIIPVMDQILVMPLVGNIDTLRAQEITRSLLRGISQQHAQIVIIDITGVPVVDSGVADHLNRTIQAARLKGAHTIITGVSDAVAETIVDLGIDWGKIDTLRDLQSGLLAAFQMVGYRMQKRS
ncbi:MAG: STAS domain-containing protein, partial [Anaerolineae bacterium]